MRPLVGAQRSFCGSTVAVWKTCDHQWPSVAISGHQWPSVAISGHQWPSVAISGHQRPSEAISGTQWHSVALRGTQSRAPCEQTIAGVSAAASSSMLRMRVMSLSRTMTLANCVSARAASLLNECLWNAEVHRGGTTAGLSIVDAAPSCEKVFSSVALRSLPRAMTMWMGSVVFTARAERSSHVMRLTSRVCAIQGTLAYLCRTQLRLKWKKRSIATSLLVLARLPLLLLQKADAEHSNVEWHPFEHMQASARSSQGPSWSAGGDGGIVVSLLHWYTAVLPLSCARAAPAMAPERNSSLSACSKKPNRFSTIQYCTVPVSLLITFLASDASFMGYTGTPGLCA